MSEPPTSSADPRTTPAEEPSLELSRTAGLKAVTLTARGHLAAKDARRLERILAGAVRSVPLVVLDLQELAAIDAACASAVITSDRAARAAGHRLAIVCLADSVAFETLGGHDDLTIIDSGLETPPAEPAAGHLELDVTLATDSAGDPHVVVCRGEIDMATAPSLRNALAGLTPSDVVVDLSRISFMDSTGLSSLLAALQAITRHEHRLVVVCPPGPVHGILRMTGLLEALSVVPDRGAAERMLAG